MEPVIYGIKSCDTIRKARRWLEQHQIAYRLHDYRTDGLDTEQLRRWCEELGWEQLLNKRGTTFRQLPATEKEGLDQASAIALMVRYPAMIKRPILDWGQQRAVGFSAEQYRAIFTTNDELSNRKIHE